MTLHIKLIAETFKLLSIIARLEGPNLSPEPNRKIMTTEKAIQLRDQIKSEETGSKTDQMFIETLTDLIENPPTETHEPEIAYSATVHVQLQF